MGRDKWINTSAHGPSQGVELSLDKTTSCEEVKLMHITTAGAAIEGDEGDVFSST